MVIVVVWGCLKLLLCSVIVVCRKCWYSFVGRWMVSRFCVFVICGWCLIRSVGFFLSILWSIFIGILFCLVFLIFR